jgi:hypothetical protein
MRSVLFVCPFQLFAAEKGAPDNVRENTYRGKHNATQTVYHFPMQVIICKPFFIGTPKHFQSSVRPVMRQETGRRPSNTFLASAPNETRAFILEFSLSICFSEEAPSRPLSEQCASSAYLKTRKSNVWVDPWVPETFTDLTFRLYSSFYTVERLWILLGAVCKPLHTSNSGRSSSRSLFCSPSKGPQEHLTWSPSSRRTLSLLPFYDMRATLTLLEAFPIHAILTSDSRGRLPRFPFQTPAKRSSHALKVSRFIHNDWARLDSFKTNVRRVLI